MKQISLEYFNFLQSIGCPYDGYVEGCGQARSYPVTTVSPNPKSGAAGGAARYYEHEYVSTITIGDSKKNKITPNDVLKYLTKDGYFQDPVTYEKLPLGNTAKVDVSITGDQVSIAYENKSEHGAVNKTYSMTVDHLIAGLKNKPMQSSTTLTDNAVDAEIGRANAPKEETDVLAMLSLVATLSSAALAAYDTRYLVKYREAAQSGRFLMNNKAYKNAFYGNQHINKSAIDAGKKAFGSSLRLANGFKYSGVGLSAIGVGFSGYQALEAYWNDDAVGLMKGMLDTAMGVVGGTGPAGTAIATYWFLSEPLREKWAEKVLLPYLETTDGVMYPAFFPSK